MSQLAEEDFSHYQTKIKLFSLVKSSQTVLALVGVGLSSLSGLPTFRDEGAFWRGHESTSMARRSIFIRDPSLVWQFYKHRRRMALDACPNRGHFALARLARLKRNFLAITQNIDGKISMASVFPVLIE
jgi:NAD+-dependent protein deacetylase sirtuin 5